MVVFFYVRLCHTKWLIFAGILRGSASNFDLSGGACGRGALRRGGSLFEKSSAKTFFGRFAVLDMEIAKSFWFSSRSREENAAQAIVRGKGKLVFLSPLLWLGLTENLQRRFSVSKMTRNQHQPFPEKFLEVSEPSFKKVLTAPVTGVSVTSSPTNPN